MTFAQAWVHIGLHKTGTTSIQQALYTSRTPLATECGVHYAGFDPNHSVWLHSMFSEAPHTYRPNVRAGVDAAEEAATINARRRRQLDAELRSSAATTLVLSGEDLSLLSPAGVRACKQWLDEVADRQAIIVFVRSPIAWATSLCAGAVRQGMTLDAAYESCVWDLRARIDPWLAAFGLASIVAIDYDDVRNGAGGIVGAFCRILGMPAGFIDRIDTSAVSNRSLSMTGARLLSELNRSRPPYVAGRRNPHRVPGDHRPFDDIGGAAFQLPRHVREQVFEASRPCCEWLAATFGIDYRPHLEQELAIGDDDAPPADVRAVALTIADLYAELHSARSRATANEAGRLRDGE